MAWAAVWPGGAGGQRPAGLTTVAAIHKLTNEQADRGLAVAFEANVTYYRKGNVDLFVQDGDTAIYAETVSDLNLATGDRVLIEGVTRGSFRPEIKATSVKVLHAGVAPPAISADFRQLIRAEYDCRRVTIRAVLRSANTITGNGELSTYLHMEMDGGPVDAEVFGAVTSGLKDLLDAEVELTGAVAGKFDTKMQMTGILMEVPSLSDMKVVRAASGAARNAEMTPMDEILKTFYVEDRSQRVRVHGSVTYYQPGSGVVLQDGMRSLWVTTQYEGPLRIGEWVTGSGFPQVQNGFLTLEHSTIDQSGRLAPVAPHAMKAGELMRGLHAWELISVEGTVVEAIREAKQDEYILVGDHHLFSAIYRHPGRGLGIPLPAMKELAVGSVVRVTGICMLDRGDLYTGLVPFDVLVRSPDDLLEVARPPLLNVRHLVEQVAVLLMVILAIGARTLSVERRLRTRAAHLAALEQMRSEILSRINRNHAVPDVLLQILEMVSTALPMARCWCAMETGDCIGEAPGNREGLRLVQGVIAARSGAPYGVLWAAFAGDAKPAADERGIVSTAAELATLAIETSNTHSDLVMRSEFDLLTGLHNRFSLEKRLDSITDKRRVYEGVHAVIYLDLDGLKGINDSFGHHVGDLYIRESAIRMKEQIRPSDLIARLGGDEFAAVISGAHTKADVEDVARRLAKCVARPFHLEGNTITGSVSYGIAYCPEDGCTRQTLLDRADAAMYKRKQAQRRAAVAVP